MGGVTPPPHGSVGLCIEQNSVDSHAQFPTREEGMAVDWVSEAGGWEGGVLEGQLLKRITA